METPAIGVFRRDLQGVVVCNAKQERRRGEGRTADREVGSCSRFVLAAF